MKTKTLLVSLAITVGATPLLAGAQDWGRHGNRGDGYGNVVRCESRDNRVNVCAADPRGDVRLVRQLSDSRCVEGRTWGHDRRGIWVDGGCRAEFAVASRGGRFDRDRRDGRGETIGYGSGVQVVRCESDDKRNRRCAASIRRGVSLQRQLSSNACIEGRTWGWDRGGIWVDQGCRGEFAVR